MVFPKRLRDGDLILQPGYDVKKVTYDKKLSGTFPPPVQHPLSSTNEHFTTTYLRQLTHFTGAYHPKRMRLEFHSKSESI